MKLNRMNGKLFLAGLAGAALLAACMMPNDSSSGSSDATALRTPGSTGELHHPSKDDDDTTKGGVAKVYVCHIPPGNPANAHTIHIGAPGVPAHLAHGDYLGKCGDAPSGSDTHHHGKKDGKDGHHSHWGHGGIKGPGHDSTGTGDTTVIVDDPPPAVDSTPALAPGDSGFAG
jgi:hypothetical protein